MTLKEKRLLEELKEYIPFDSQLGDILGALEKRLSLNSYQQKIYDYFYSHILDNGDIVSLYRYLKEQRVAPDQEAYYKQLDSEFTCHLFQKQKPLFFFDVDNTITELGVLPSEKRIYMDHYPEKERIILSTGKVYQSITDVIEACHLEANYASTLNGSVLIKNHQATLLEHLGRVAEPLIQAINEAGLQILYYTCDQTYSNAPLSEENYTWMHKYNEDYKINPFIPYDQVIKILIFIYDFEPLRSQKEAFIDDLAAHYPSLTTCRTGHHCYEILKKDQHKGTTVKMISRLLGRYYRCSIGCGDSMNDLRLLDYVGRPYMVSDGSEELKEMGIPIVSSNRKTDINELLEYYK